MSEEKKKPVTPRPAATVLMLRDGPNGMEVFMVKRHHKIDFATGALVFPGGSADPGDGSDTVRRRADGADGLSAEALRFRTACVREAFEETGLLLCRRADKPEVLEADECAALQHYRAKLEANELDFGEFLEAENLIACLDRLAHFAHWITPAGMPKRFDTHFYVARTPARQLAKHDGSENVDSVWITPAEACAAADRGEYTVIFPTRVNIEKLDRMGKDVATAMANIDKDQVVTVLPQVTPIEGGRIMKIPAEAGYGFSEVAIKGVPGTQGNVQVIERDGQQFGLAAPLQD
ncbi:MAG: NUDIX domain-containing protein [Alphaproteobacteria bacterium]|nr:NUDIX domain-containing protein [Alphaproteobacteria bacterium]MCB9930494.1 NUDIX domain-containing protein [Alphaproteobacteria bacterium]